MPRSPDREPADPANPESDAEESIDLLLLEAAEALDPPASDVLDPRNDRATLASESSVLRLAAGTLIAGRYRLEQWLGEGGMGEVWAATHVITRRRVAMKFLKGTAARRSAMHQRFLREARAASLVRHPSVVEVLDVFELEGGAPVMVMELLEGETLGAKLVRDRSLPVGQVIDLVLPVIDAVEAAHARGIVHRDLKPDNIFLEAGERGQLMVKVLDFGIAKLTAKEGDAVESGALTGSGSVLGTPWYMAPEQLGGEADIDARADVWALGVILYECLSGRRPVDGSNIAQLVTRILRDRMVPIEERVPGLAPELAHLIGRMLARERADRPRDVSEVRQVLTRLAGRRESEPFLATGESEEKKWDTGVPHAVPGRSRASRSLGVSRIPAGLAAVIAVGGLAWSAAHFVSRRPVEAPADASAILTTSLAATGIPNLSAGVGPAPRGTEATSVSDIAGLAAPSAPAPSSVEAASPSPYRARPAISRPKESAVAARAHGIADAGVTVTKDPPVLPTASVQPAASARHKPERGGLFEAVPF